MIIHASDFGGECSCGRNHAMQTKMVVIEAGCLARFDEYTQQCGLSGYRTVIYDKDTYNAKGLVRPSAHQEIILDSHNLHADENAVGQVLERLTPEAQVLVAVGSGTIHDVTRYCAKDRGLPFISCPTAASVDGFCSGVAAMTWKGAKKSFTAIPPVLVLADLNVISQAPLRLTLAGAGDMFGNHIALADWRIAHILTGEFYCDRIAKITEDSTQAVMDCAEQLAAGEPAAFEKLTYGLILSGLAMQMMGNSRPASGAEHHISHIIEMSPEALDIYSDALHGEKVGVGTLLAVEEYHRLASHFHWKDYEPFTEKEIHAVFGQRLCNQVWEENQEDPAIGITGRSIEANLPQIQEQLSKIPRLRKLTELYQCLNMKQHLVDIHVPEERKSDLLDACPMVRRRLTLMRLRRCLD